MDDALSGLVSNRFEIEVGLLELRMWSRLTGQQVKLADLQADPNSPLYSIKKFEDLPM